MTKYQHFQKAIDAVIASLPEVERCQPGPEDRQRCEMIFDAGAAWQREQDAKIAEGPLFNSFSGKKIAERIRATAFDDSPEKTEKKS